MVWPVSFEANQQLPSKQQGQLAPEEVAALLRSDSAQALRAAVQCLPRGYHEQSRAIVRRWVELECDVAPRARASAVPERCFTWCRQQLPLPEAETEPPVVTAAAASGGASAKSDQAVMARICALYEQLLRGQVHIGIVVRALDALPLGARRLFQAGPLRTACADRRSPIDSGDYEVLASALYCEVCRATSEHSQTLIACTGCGVAAYCCVEHRHQDRPRHVQIRDACGEDAVVFGGAAFRPLCIPMSRLAGCS